MLWSEFTVANELKGSQFNTLLIHLLLISIKWSFLLEFCIKANQFVLVYEIMKQLSMSVCVVMEGVPIFIDLSQFSIEISSNHRNIMFGYLTDKRG